MDAYISPANLRGHLRSQKNRGCPATPQAPYRQKEQSSECVNELLTLFMRGGVYGERALTCIDYAPGELKIWYGRRNGAGGDAVLLLGTATPLGQKKRL